MPNHCTNTLTLEGPAEDIRAWMESHIRPGRGEDGGLIGQLGLTFEGSVPMPNELRETRSPVKEKDDRLIALYGWDNWYDWACANWGTKWNAYDYEMVDALSGSALSGSGIGDITVRFTTAWGPPETWLRKMAALYPTLRVQCVCYVEGDEPCILIEPTAAEDDLAEVMGYEGQEEKERADNLKYEKWKDEQNESL